MLDDVVELVCKAGGEILRCYGQEVETTEKDGGRGPLTAADMAAHHLLVEGLTALAPEIPVLSEESDEEELVERRTWERFWLVDPLDGTKEFLSRNGEFTVNVALIEGEEPVLGVVHAPVLDTTYLARRGEGARVRRPGEPEARIAVRARPAEGLVLAVSRSHLEPRLAARIERRPELSVVSMGSSLKFCLVAEGRADLYPRLGPTMEWDTGAAQCVLEEAGGALLDLEGRPLRYRKEVLQNPSVVAVGDPAVPWRELLALE